MQNPGHDPAHIERGDYQADVQRGGTVEPFWYYIIRRKDSNQIINIEKFKNRKQAIEAAQDVLARMNPSAAAR
jgi:hypothetical protein